MKRIVICMIAVILLLSACGKQPQQGSAPAAAPDAEYAYAGEIASPERSPAPDWTHENEIYGETYRALQEAPVEGLPLVETLRYDSEAGLPYFDFTDTEQEVVELVLETLAPVWEGKEVPMFGAEDDAETVFRFFSNFDCASIALKLPYVKGDTCSISDIQNLTAFEYCGAYFDASSLPVLPGIIELTLPNAKSAAMLPGLFPGLEKLTFITYGETIPREIYELEQLGALVEISLYDMDKQPLLPTPETEEFFMEARMLPNVRMINGIPISEFEIEAEEEALNQVDQNNIISEAKDYSAKMQQLMYDNGVYHSAGSLVAGEKVLVYIQSSSLSVESALAGEDFEGIPSSRLATGMEEADALILIYPYYETVGFYSNGGGPASKTYTMVVTVEMGNNDEYASYVVAADDPPTEITITGNLPIGGSGTFMREEALEYVRGLL